MLLVAGMILGVGAALLRHGLPLRVVAPFRGIPALGAYGVLVTLILLSEAVVGHPLVSRVGLFVATAAVGIVVCAVNYMTPGMLVLGMGLLMNLCVVSANAGMPVDLNLLAGLDSARFYMLQTSRLDSLHTVLTADTALWFLADVLPVHCPKPFAGIVSLGDVYASIGAGMAAFRLLGHEVPRDSIHCRDCD